MNRVDSINRGIEGLAPISDVANLPVGSWTSIPYSWLWGDPELELEV